LVDRVFSVFGCRFPLVEESEESFLGLDLIFRFAFG
jgi:hypothetical protein